VRIRLQRRFLYGCGRVVLFGPCSALNPYQLVVVVLLALGSLFLRRVILWENTLGSRLFHNGIVGGFFGLIDRGVVNLLKKLPFKHFIRQFQALVTFELPVCRLIVGCAANLLENEVAHISLRQVKTVHVSDLANFLAWLLSCLLLL